MGHAIRSRVDNPIREAYTRFVPAVKRNVRPSENKPMNTKLVLRVAIVCEWVFGAISLVLSFTLEDTLPIQLREYLEWEANQDLTVLDLGLGVTFVALFIAYLGSSLSLFLLRRWARWMYLACVIGIYILIPLAGPTVEHGLADTFDGVSEVLSGVIIALTFFTNVLSPGKQTGGQLSEANRQSPPLK